MKENILQKITNERKSDVALARQQVSFDVLMAEAEKRQHHSFIERISANDNKITIISEIKKASPSAGLLRPDYRPQEIAAEYERVGASAISVLTEPRYFMGDEAHLRAVRGAVKIPILRKDFICDKYQIAEAAAWGADIILLIVAALEYEQLRELYDFAIGLGLEVLVESHSREELETALQLEQGIIGINSRNLKTLKTDLQTAFKLSEYIPDNRISIAESGITSKQDIIQLSNAGYHGFLIGEMLMRGDNPGKVLASLLE